MQKNRINSWMLYYNLLFSVHYYDCKLIETIDFNSETS